MAERDPRVDPRPGDVLTRGGDEVEVLYFRYLLGIAKWRTRGGKSMRCSAIAWRKWAANATVVRRGEG
jgi:hypothetical protein